MSRDGAKRSLNCLARWDSKELSTNIGRAYIGPASGQTKASSACKSWRFVNLAILAWAKPPAVDPLAVIIVDVLPSVRFFLEGGPRRTVGEDPMAESRSPAESLPLIFKLILDSLKESSLPLPHPDDDDLIISEYRD